MKLPVRWSNVQDRVLDSDAAIVSASDINALGERLAVAEKELAEAHTGLKCVRVLAQGALNSSSRDVSDWIDDVTEIIEEVDRAIVQKEGK